MDDDIPSGAEILAMRLPSQLFGSPLEDGRALRKRWARIARAFRDTEPDVFQHARQLFERARDGEGDDLLIRGVPVRSADKVNPLRDLAEQHAFTVPPGVAAADGVAQWVARRDHAALAAVVEMDPGSIAGNASMRDVLMIVVHGGGPDLTESQVRAVKRELNHELLDISPGDEASLRAALSQTHRLRQMRVDGSVPQAIRDLVRASRTPTPHAFVAALNQFVSVGTLHSQTEVLTELRRRYPSAWTTIVQATETLARHRRRTLGGVPVPPALITVLTRRMGVSDGYMFWLLGVFGGVFGLIAVAATWMATGMLPDEDGVKAIVGIAGLLAAVCAMATAWTVDVRRKRRATDLRDRLIHELAAEFGLFPVEVCRAIRAAAEPEDRAGALESTLRELELDPRLFLELWTPELIARLLASDASVDA